LRFLKIMSNVVSTIQANLGTSSGSPQERSIEMAVQSDVYRCDVCGNEMLEIHCKIICPQCGFIRDCSDP
jgi:rubrerythrin